LCSRQSPTTPSELQDRDLGCSARLPCLIHRPRNDRHHLVEPRLSRVLPFLNLTVCVFFVIRSRSHVGLLKQLTLRNLSCVLRLQGLTLCAIASGRSTQDRFQ